MGPLDVCQRIRKITERPHTLEFRLLYDKEREVWLGELDARLLDLAYDRLVAADGASPADVLRKLAELMEV